MNFYDILLAKKLSGGGGGDITTEALNVTANGQYTAPQGKAYTPVNVNIAGYKVGEVETPTPIATFNGTDNPLKSLTASIVPVQSGSGDPSPENVRPITGWTEEVVTRCGKNQAKKTIHGYINLQNSKMVIDNDSESVVFYAVAGKTYTVSSSVTMDRSTLGLADTDNITNQYQLLDIAMSNEVGRWTATWTGWTVWYKCTSAQSGFANSVQVEFGTTATTYEPYAGTTTTIPFTDSQGNPVEVYGGSVDVVNGGERQRTLGSVDLGTLRWIKNSGRFEAQLPNNSQTYAYNSDLSDLMSEMWTPKVRDAGWNNMTDGQYGIAERQLRIKYSSVETAEEFATLVNGSIFLYPLATPTTFYTQPTAVKSVDGENNVFASTGDVEELKYFEEL